MKSIRFVVCGLGVLMAFSGEAFAALYPCPSLMVSLGSKRLDLTLTTHTATSAGLRAGEFRIFCSKYGVFELSLSTPKPSSGVCPKVTVKRKLSDPSWGIGETSSSESSFEVSAGAAGSPTCNYKTSVSHPKASKIVKATTAPKPTAKNSAFLVQ